MLLLLVSVNRTIVELKWYCFSSSLNGVTLLIAL